MSALDALLGKIAVNGQEIELRGTLNFAEGFEVTDEADMNTISVASVEGPPGPTGPAGPTGPTGPASSLSAKCVGYGNESAVIVGSGRLTFDNAVTLGTERKLRVNAAGAGETLKLNLESTSTGVVRLECTDSVSAVVAGGFHCRAGVTPLAAYTGDEVHGVYACTALGVPYFISPGSSTAVTNLGPFPDKATTVSVTTTNATPTTLLAIATVADNTILTLGIRITGRIASPSTTTMIYEATAMFKRINAGSAAAYGSVAVSTSVKDDATWGDPAFVLATNDLSVTVTGKAATTIKWKAEVWFTQVGLPT